MHVTQQKKETTVPQVITHVYDINNTVTGYFKTMYTSIQKIKEKRSKKKQTLYRKKTIVNQ